MWKCTKLALIILNLNFSQIYASSTELMRFEVIFGLLNSQDEGTAVLQNIRNNFTNQ
jgi:hypothetical protein